jgi:endonuclease/exonuclease/phosphatase family metal-dependent hydrolase
MEESRRSRRKGIPLPDTPDRELKLATYNIHGAVGPDGRFDPDRVLAVLHELNADVIALQELESHYEPARNMLEYFASGTGLTPIAGLTVLKKTSGYGNALLTRLPATGMRRIDLTIPGHEARGALDVDLGWDDLRLHVVATHLGLRPGERRRQVRQLLRLFEADGAHLDILLGDLNEWFLWGRPLRWLHRRFSSPPAYRTFPARCPLFALDRIWVQPHAALVRIGPHATRLARSASDHLPLMAVIKAPAAGRLHEGDVTLSPGRPLPAGRHLSRNYYLP